MSIPNATEVQNTLLAIVTAARGGEPGDMRLAAQLTAVFQVSNGSILPLFISAVALIETILLSIAHEVGVEPDKLFAGICLGLSLRQIQEQNQQEEGTSE